MDGEFRGRRWVIVALAIVAAVAIGATAYQAGVAQGVAMQAPTAAAPGAAGGGQGVQPAPYPYYPYHHYGPWRFGFFGFFGPLLTIFLFVFLFRALFWGLGGWRRHRMYWNYDPELGQGRFDEWHRRAHERMGGGGTAPSAS